MNDIHAELQSLEELRRVPELQKEYDEQAGPKMENYSFLNTAWYRARGLVAQAEIAVRQADAQVQHAQMQHALAVQPQAQVYGHGAAYGFGRGGFNVNVNAFAGAGMVAALPRYARVPQVPPRALPVLPAVAQRPRARAQRR